MWKKILLFLFLLLLVAALFVFIKSREQPLPDYETLKFPTAKDLIISQEVDNSERSPNFLFLIGDDMGLETMTSYGIGEDPAFTPNLDKLASRGMRFENFWTEPTCTPTRAAILSGRTGLHTGVTIPIYQRWYKLGATALEKPAHATKEMDATPLAWIEEGKDQTLAPLPLFLKLKGTSYNRGIQPDEVLLPRILKSLDKPYSTAAFGKWHLCDLYNGDLTHPNKVGFDLYKGPFFGNVYSYFTWRDVSNGEIENLRGYVDEHYTEEAIKFIQSKKENPWMVWMSFINPHLPLHLPPKHLLQSDKSKNLDPDQLSKENRRPYFNAQIEALDFLIGKLIAGIPEEQLDNTYIIFLGDNGTGAWSQPSPPLKPNRVKMSVYTGGVQTPLIISGPGIDSNQVAGPIAHATDLFSTVLDLSNVNYESKKPLDGTSLKPYLLNVAHPEPRQSVYAYTDLIRENFAIKNAEYKLIVNDDAEEFYFIKDDLLELNPLLIESLVGEELQNYQELKNQYQELFKKEKI